MDNLVFGLQVSLLGFTTVITALLVLYAVLLLFTRLFNRMPPGNSKIDLPPDTGDAAAGMGITPEMVAALTAAVSRYLELTGLHDKPLAITVERAQETPRNSWAAAGRRVMMEGKLDLERLRRSKIHEKV